MSCSETISGGNTIESIDRSFEILVNICRTAVPEPVPLFSNTQSFNNINNSNPTIKNKKLIPKSLRVVKKPRFQKIVSIKVNHRRDKCNRLKNTLNNDINSVNQCLNEIKVTLEHKHSLSDLIIKRKKLLEDLRNRLKSVKSIITGIFCTNHESNGLNNKLKKKCEREKQLKSEIKLLEVWIEDRRKVFCYNIHKPTESCILCLMPKIEYLNSENKIE